MENKSITHSQALELARELVDSLDINWEKNVPKKLLEHYSPKLRAALQFTGLTEEIPCIIKGVHIFKNKTKYDLEIFILTKDGWKPTRIYNVDSELVTLIY